MANTCAPLDSIRSHRTLPGLHFIVNLVWLTRFAWTTGLIKTQRQSITDLLLHLKVKTTSYKFLLSKAKKRGDSLTNVRRTSDRVSRYFIPVFLRTVFVYCMVLLLLVSFSFSVPCSTVVKRVGVNEREGERDEHGVSKSTVGYHTQPRREPSKREADVSERMKWTSKTMIGSLVHAGD
ncbi:Protein of unknown function [Cotesia congregata]|uniref:Transmembrane protein n=1 Tax=Cotesia congregata TaxID=51543 RepID=A0A8J2HAQ1_COTCN|nr:Protein of unknown function [Cotesia congregata]